MAKRNSKSKAAVNPAAVFKVGGRARVLTGDYGQACGRIERVHGDKVSLMLDVDLNTGKGSQSFQTSNLVPLA